MLNQLKEIVKEKYKTKKLNLKYQKKSIIKIILLYQ